MARRRTVGFNEIVMRRFDRVPATEATVALAGRASGCVGTPLYRRRAATMTGCALAQPFDCSAACKTGVAPAREGARPF
jgi:hypothetical protein